MATRGPDNLFIAKGAGAQLVVAPTQVVIQRRDLGGDNLTIPMYQIATVHLKKPGGLGALTPGVFRVVLVGEQELLGRSGWAWNAMQDPHAILMTLRRYPEFVRAKELIEQYQAARHAPPDPDG
jgi:hypothetical protein